MLSNKLFTYGSKKGVKRVAASILLLFIFLTPIQNVLGTPTVAHAQTATTTPQSGSQIEWCSSNAVSTCLSGIVYIFAVFLPINFAYVAGYIFNAALQLALTSGAYALNFLSQGWTIVRDIANLTFIFILVYIAYIVIVRAETSGTMRMLAWVVAMALLINFSFFITRVVIDAGNILAVQFYNAININASTASPLSAQSCPPTCVKDLTGGIMDALKVQGLLGSDSFKAFMGNQQSGVGTFLTNVLIQILVFIATGIFLSLLGFIFLIAGIKFMVRLVTLWLAIIASPLAFAAYAVPEGNTAIKKYREKWQDNLLQSSFYPAVFLFLFFVMNLFLQTLAGQQGLIPDVFSGAQNIVANQGNSLQIGLSIIANIAIRLGLVTTLLYFAMKASDGFSSAGSSIAREAIGWGGSKATSFVASSSAWAGRNSIGRGAGALANSAPIRSLAEQNKAGRYLSNSLKKIETSSFDARRVPGVERAFYATSTGAALSGVTINAGKPSSGNPPTPPPRNDRPTTPGPTAAAPAARVSTVVAREDVRPEQTSREGYRQPPQPANDNQPGRVALPIAAHNDNGIATLSVTKKIEDFEKANGSAHLAELRQQRLNQGINSQTASNDNSPVRSTQGQTQGELRTISASSVNTETRQPRPPETPRPPASNSNVQNTGSRPAVTPMALKSVPSVGQKPAEHGADIGSDEVIKKIKHLDTRLKEMQHSIAEQDNSALQPQIKRLDTRLRQIQESAANQNRGQQNQPGPTTLRTSVNGGALRPLTGIATPPTPTKPVPPQNPQAPSSNSAAPRPATPPAPPTPPHTDNQQDARKAT